MENRWYIRAYQKADEEALFSMMKRETDWEAYCFGEGRKKYTRALQTSLTYLLMGSACMFMICWLMPPAEGKTLGAI